MARGWESKAIEAQQDEAGRSRGTRQTGHDPAGAARQQDINGLLLARARAMADLKATSSPSRRAALEAAVRDLDARLAALGHPGLR